jgi:hypothetical protein
VANATAPFCSAIAESIVLSEVPLSFATHDQSKEIAQKARPYCCDIVGFSVAKLAPLPDKCDAQHLTQPSTATYKLVQAFCRKPVSQMSPVF